MLINRLTGYLAVSKAYLFVDSIYFYILVNRYHVPEDGVLVIISVVKNEKCLSPFSVLVIIGVYIMYDLCVLSCG